VRIDPPDFGAVLHAVDRAEPGDVIVIAAGGRVDVAVLGEILGGVARRRGVAGVVCDGALRDVAALVAWDDFPAFARGTTARGPSSKQGGAVDGAVSFAGLGIETGMLVVGDDDGLVVLSRTEAEALIDAAEERSAAEFAWVARLDAGETLAAVFGLAAPTVAP
jgi:regulator of RNase E activity RraA